MHAAAVDPRGRASCCWAGGRCRPGGERQPALLRVRDRVAGVRRLRRLRVGQGDAPGLIARGRAPTRTAQPAPGRPPGRTQSAANRRSGRPPTTTATDEELAAYNRYLAWLNANPHAVPVRVPGPIVRRSDDNGARRSREDRRAHALPRDRLHRRRAPAGAGLRGDAAEATSATTRPWSARRARCTASSTWSTLSSPLTWRCGRSGHSAEPSWSCWPARFRSCRSWPSARSPAGSRQRVDHRSGVYLTDPPTDARTANARPGWHGTTRCRQDRHLPEVRGTRHGEL